MSDGGLRTSRGARWGERIAQTGLRLSATSVLLVLAFIVWVLVSNSAAFFSSVHLWDFLTGTEWESAGTVEISEGADAGHYGILPLLAGTLLVTVGAIVVGLPIGLGTAIYLAEYANPRTRALVKPALELLAGIPSIVFGYFALLVVSPLIQDWTAPGTLLGDTFGSARIFNAASAMVVVGLMVLPIITTLSEDALRAVPRHLREASLGLGATRWETTRKVVVPAALSGITASFVLGVSRAIGESMAVSMVAGTQARWTFNPVEAVQTMTAFIVQRTSGDVPQTGTVYNSLFAVGLSLFALTLLMNALAQRFVKRFRTVE
jgi:phosphate transport system permease protein